MPVQVLIPTPLQKYTGEQASVSVEATSVAALIDTLEAMFPGIRPRLCDEKGQIRRFLNFYVNSEDIRFLDNEATALGPGDEVSIVPAVAGG
ncbi:MAG: MoaD/ThiS family protein [Cyanobacteriota bacterium]|nr:MoaD/ThiS family protein [Cyanobacteriota bacterium]